MSKPTAFLIKACPIRPVPMTAAVLAVTSSPRKGRYGCQAVHRFSLTRSEEHTSELQSLAYLVCRLLLEKKKEPHGKPAEQEVAWYHRHRRRAAEPTLALLTFRTPAKSRVHPVLFGTSDDKSWSLGLRAS